MKITIYALEMKKFTCLINNNSSAGILKSAV